MSLVFLPSSKLPSSHFNQLEYNLRPNIRAFPNATFSFVHCKVPMGISRNFHTIYRNESHNVLKPAARECMNSDYQAVTEENAISFDWGDQEQEDMEDLESPWEGQEQEDMEDLESPWEGAVMYRRNLSNLHLEYCTTLERLGLSKLSTEISKSRASVMGLRVTKAVKDYPHGTPVQISIDVTRRKQSLRLDGIIKTVITLHCYRCSEPAAESVFSNFSLLLTEEPVEEPEFIDMIFVEDTSESRNGSIQEDDEDASIDWEDRLYFPPQEKEIDISKHIRDMVYLEVGSLVLCDPGCKGICETCGTNFNTSSCDCSQEEAEGSGYNSPFRNLREQIQQKR